MFLPGKEEIEVLHRLLTELELRKNPLKLEVTMLYAGRLEFIDDLS